MKNIGGRGRKSQIASNNDKTVFGKNVRLVLKKNHKNFLCPPTMVAHLKENILATPNKNSRQSCDHVHSYNYFLGYGFVHYALLFKILIWNIIKIRKAVKGFVVDKFVGI